MRNAGFVPDCGCGSVIGEIRDDLKYPFGAVTANQLREIITRIDNEMERLNNFCIGLDRKNSVNEANIANNKENITDTRITVDRIQGTLIQLRENVIALMSSIDKVNNKVDASEATIADLVTKTDNVISEISTVTESVTALSDNLQKTEKTLTEATESLSERVAALEGDDPAILIRSLMAIPKTAELGSSADVAITWELSKTPKTATLNGINVLGGNSYTDVDVTESKEYKLIVSDDLGRKTSATVAVKFLNKIFWGESASTEITENLVEHLNNSELSDAKARTITVSPNEQYVYYAYPKRLGTASFRLGMLEGGFEGPVTVHVTNQHGYAEDYYVYKSDKQLIGDSVDFVIL